MANITARRPSRVILNFSHKCALNCEWCYVPFGGLEAQFDVVSNVVDRVVQLGFTSITFGGGDPFQYSFIEFILRRAKMSGLYVHVDTHGKALRQSEKNLALLIEAVDLLGLPLDGSTSDMHNQMRSTAGHFEIISCRLDWLKLYRERLKINTLVSARNVEDLPILANLVVSVAPIRWSIYQYWSLGPGESVSPIHCVSDQKFEENARHAAKIMTGSNTIVEINNRESRRGTYPIVHHDGSIFVHSPAPHNSFQCIGSIFDEGALPLITKLCGGEREAAVSRYDNVRKRDC
jgi:MoaA/NifB/PqqE/SkfB family radical SAM enzyme